MAETALDAMNEALTAVPGTGVAPKLDPAEELPDTGVNKADGADDKSVDADAETDAGGSESEVADDGETPPEKDGEGDETPPEKDGKPPKTVKKDAAEPELGADGKPVVKEEKPKEPPRPVDPVNDPIPVGVAARTSERIQSLIGMVKERDTIVATHHEMMGLISGTGATPDEFGSMVTYMRLVHSDSIEDKRAALKIAQSELRSLAIELGEPVEGYDALAEHADLAERVEAGTLSRADAQEIAVGRTRRATTAATNATAVEQARVNAEHQTAVQAGVAELNAYGTEMAAKDPLYGQKYAILVGGKNADGTKYGGTLTAVISQLHPTKWKATFEAAYKNLRVTAPVGGAPVVTPKQQPLRQKTPSGDGKKVPTTALEAMNAALEGR